MTRTHKQLGLRKPSNRTTKMGAVDGENLELFTFNPSDPACRVHGLAIARHHIGISKSGQTSLSLRKFVNPTERHPRQVISCASARNGGKKKSYDRYGESGRNKSIEENSQLHQQSASGNLIFGWHLQTPGAGCNSKRSMAAPGSEPVARRARQLRR